MMGNRCRIDPGWCQEPAIAPPKCGSCWVVVSRCGVGLICPTCTDEAVAAGQALAEPLAGNGAVAAQALASAAGVGPLQPKPPRPPLGTGAYHPDQAGRAPTPVEQVAVASRKEGRVGVSILVQRAEAVRAEAVEAKAVEAGRRLARSAYKDSEAATCGSTAAAGPPPVTRQGSGACHLYKAVKISVVACVSDGVPQEI